MGSFFIELSFVMILTFIISFIANKLKQPLLIGYIFTGIIAGPFFFNILSDTQGYETFSHIGIALLLFIVGLHLNLKLIKEVGAISLITGLGQVFFTSTIGFTIAHFLGFNLMASLIISIALTFSSTIIIVKLLTDKNDLDKLYGKISMGFLIVQDFVAVFILMILSSFLTIDGMATNTYFEIFKTIAIGLIAITSTYVLAHYFLPKFLDKIAKSSELLFIFVISWAFGISSIFYYFGFSIEVGALLAGIALASSPYQFEISSRIRPLRDFFIVMFFILLGSQMIPITAGFEVLGLQEKLAYLVGSIMPLLTPAIIFSIFILVGNPIIVLFLMVFLGYSSRTGFLAGLTVAQISEFSLILALMSQKAGFLTPDEVSMITFIGIITITASTYLILHGERLYKKFAPILRKLDKNLSREKEILETVESNYEILVFGYDRIGYSLLKSIDKLKKKYLVIDYDPEVIKKLKQKGVNCIYGDAGDVNFISEFNFKSVKLLISTIPDYEINMTIFKEFKKINTTASVILTSAEIETALDLYELGVDYVILPNYLGGHYVSTLIETYEGNFQNFLKEKIQHINELKERKIFKSSEGKVIK